MYGYKRCKKPLNFIYHNLFWQERTGVGPSNNDFADDGAADMRKFGLRNKKNRLYAVSYNVVELRNGFFVIKIGGIAQSAQQEARTNAVAVMRGEVFEVVHFYLWVFFEYFPQPL